MFSDDNMSPAQWIKRNMLGIYSEELGRPLTEAEIRVQRSLEKLPVPDWFNKYSKPPQILKNPTPIECRRPTWKTMKTKIVNVPKRKNAKNKSPRKTPRKTLKKTQSANTCTSTPRNSLNQTYKVSSTSPNEDESPCNSKTPPSITDSDVQKLNDVLDKSPKDSEITTQISRLDVNLNRSSNSMQHYTPLMPSHTFPRMSPSRKIENINIVFEKQFPPDPSVNQKFNTNMKTVYTMTKNIEVRNNEDMDDTVIETSLNDVSSNHASFLYAEIEPSGVKTKVQVFAGVEESSDETPNLKSPLPSNHFFNSSKKSTELERIVQSERRGSRSQLIQEIIEELNRSVAESCGRASLDINRSLSRNAPERSNYSKNEEEICYNSSDSDLAKSSESSSQSTSPLPQSEEEAEQQDGQEDVHWIPCKMIPLTCCCRQATAMQMPRTSSMLSMQSKGSGAGGQGNGRSSPDLSPIMGEETEASTQQQQRFFDKMKKQKGSRRLFRIDEVTGVIDSGYSDRSDCVSISSLPTLPDNECDVPGRMATKLESQIYPNYWCEFAAAFKRAFGDLVLYV